MKRRSAGAFRSVLLLLNEDVPLVMDQSGHADPKATLGIYARVMRRTVTEKERVRTLVDGGRTQAAWPRLASFEHEVRGAVDPPRPVTQVR